MRNYFRTKIHHVAMMLLMLFVGVQTVQANDEFEQQRNFMVTKSSQTTIHFRLLTYAYGRIRDHWACNEKGKRSEIRATRYKIKADGTVNYDNPIDSDPIIIASFCGYDSDTPDKVWLQMHCGSATITNSKGHPHGLTVGTEQQVETTVADGMTDFSFLEFDWYPPNDMIIDQSQGQGKDPEKYAIAISIIVQDDYPLGGPEKRTYPANKADWTFNLSDSYVSASIQDPVFYPFGGSDNIGKLAVPYSIQNRPLSYRTNFDSPDVNYPITAQGGMIYIAAEDTFRASLNVTFNALRDAQSNSTWPVPSNSVYVPPYHHIHDFKVSTYVPDDGAYKGLYMGAKKLEWDVHYADQNDILENDLFVIERAYKSDFSDAEQIESVVYMPLPSRNVKDGEENQKQHYEYVDDSQGAWYNPENPERPVFYRVRRASSEPWGWDHKWAAKDSIANPVYLAAPSRNIPVQVVKDEDYENNRRIQVIISMDASCVPAIVKHDMKDREEYENIVRNLVWDKSATLYLVRHMSHEEGVESQDGVKIPVNPSDITYDPIGKCWKARVYDTPKFPCTYYSYSVEVETDFNTTLPKMKEENIKNIIPPEKDGSVGDYLVGVQGMTAVPDYSPLGIKTENFYFSTAAKVTDLQASQGDYNDHVALTWKNDGGECDYYIITRYDPITKTTVTLSSSTDLLSDCFYNDSTAIGGREYTYYVQSVLQCANSNMVVSEADTVSGKANREAHIYGKLYYTNGMAVANKTVVAKKGEEEISSAQTNEDGSYNIIIADRPSDNDILTITIEVADGHQTFTLPGTKDQYRQITISETHYNIPGNDFVSDDYIRFSGRVLYEGTSVPVSGASFLINEKVAKNKEGKNVITDSQGNFEITVPKGVNFTLQTVKDKHKFANDGYFMGTDSNDKPTKNLNFTANQDQKYFWDQTKVRLMGRVVGGDDQGKKPLGMDRSINNLGDDLQMVFALEGNDVAHLVYNPLDRNEKERDTTIVHADGTHKTKVHFDTKRVVINPDSLSGEYIVELLPEKYKVIQATAKGYSTLFAKGIGAAVVDLTNKLDTLYLGETEEDSITCNEHFSVIYHAPVQLTFQQTNYGRALNYFGDEELAMSDFNARTTRIKVVDVQKEDTVSYTFGYPVFNGITLNSANKNKYAFSLSAHEDYYYNNDKQAATPDVVYVKGGKVKVSNGFDINPDGKNEYVQLDSNGKGIAQVTVYNPTFKLTGEDALRNLQFSMDYNGETVLSETLRAFVTGAKEMGSDVIGKHIKVFDVLRDPPGSASYAWLDEGSTYAGAYSVDVSISAGVKFEFQIGSKKEMVSGVLEAPPTGVGVWYGTPSTSGKVQTFPLDFVYNDKFKKTYGYSYTTSERIQTSSSDTYVGNMGNVYIGTEIASQVNRYETIAAISDSTYKRMMPAINSGEVKILAKGTTVNAEGTEEPVYLAVSRQISFSALPTSTFAHTQKHIIKNLIPELLATRNALLQFGEEETLQQLANESGKNVYMSLVSADSLDFGIKYKKLTPYKKSDVNDEIQNLNECIAAWTAAIAANERITLEAFYQNSKVKSISVSAGTSKQVTETATYSYDHNAPTSASDIWNFGLKGISSATTKFLDVLVQKAMKKIDDSSDQALTDKADEAITNIAELLSGKQDEVNEQNQTILGFTFSIKVHPISDFSVIGNLDQNKKHTRTVGYKIEEGNHGHINVGVYRTPKTLTPGIMAFDYLMFPGDDAPKKYVEKLQETWSTISLPSDETDDNGKTVDVDWTDEKYNAADYVFLCYGGATRCPYEDAEYTYFYQPGTKLSNATLKIDDPHIQVKNPVVSDIPDDQPAVFDIVLSNESEAPEADGYLIDKTFNFSIDAATNPDGAKFYLDGYPLANGMSLVLPRGKAVHKKLEMYRGSADDYENIKLLFYTSCEFGNGVNTKISAHFQPSSTPLNLTTPTDKWVMNTLSPQNDGKFYIPVKIDGFNTEYRNFDHIELQYKRSTQPDNDYVNLCSFYSDSTLYANASGEKRFIKGGVIDDLYFYGENDPVEQNYDLRAVSFCRLGNGFVTRSSKVLSGVKDTRRPEVFGSISPKTGVLGIGDYIGIPFSENIAGNHLDQTTSFEVMGYTNKTGIVNSTALSFNGIEDCAETEVNRSLANKDFTIDMMVQPKDNAEKSHMAFFTQGNDKSNIVFGSTDNKLYFRMTMNGITHEVMSDSTFREPNSKEWTRVAAVCEKDTVTFYKEKQPIGKYTLASLSNYDGVGKLIFGRGIGSDTHYSGNMLEARVWTKALTSDEITNTNRVTLTGYERKLLAYYSMNDGKGTLLEDKAHGASLELKGPSWSLPSGRSLQFDGTKGVELEQALFSRSSMSSYMLGLWFKTADSSESTMALYAEGDGTKNTQGLFLGLEKKQLKVAQNGFSMKAVGDYADGKWHHAVLGVDRLTNKAYMNVDGKKVMQFAADSLGALGINNVMLGAYRKQEAGKAPKDTCCLNGYIDDVMLWETVMSDGYMKRFEGSVPNGGELGLLVNLTFSEGTLDSDGNVNNSYSGRNHLDENKRNGENANKMVVKTDVKEMSQTQSIAPVRDKDLISPLKFSYASKDNELVINLNVDDAEINKQNVFITVYDVEDMAGNTIANPVNMTLFVDRNHLKWDQKYVDCETWTGYGDEFSVDIHNIGGYELNYTIDDLPDWLTVDYDRGSLAPTDVRPVKFKVKNNLNAGEHSSLIYLTDQNGLYEPLLVTVNVKTSAPEWCVDKSLFSETMNVVGEVHIQENGSKNLDTDSDDIVGAFIGNVCVGVQNIDYNGKSSSLYMTIYGNGELSALNYKNALNHNGKVVDTFEKNVVFRLWRSKTGQISELNLSNDNTDIEITFIPNHLYGKPDNPVIMTTMQRGSQILSLEPGWNWVSFNIATDTKRGNFTQAIANDFPFHDGDIVKGQGMFSQYLYDKGWQGQLNQFDHHFCYMFWLQEGGDLEIFGNELKGETINLRKGWNNLPYFGKHVLSIKEAMANYPGKEGDIIKGYTEFAILNQNNEWKGSLTEMRPGQGYMLHSETIPDNTAWVFSYPINEYYDGGSNVSQAAPRRAFAGEHSSNMPIVAEAMMSDGTKAMQGDVLQAYCGSELVGEAVADDEGKFYLMTSAENGDLISFRLSRSADDSEASVSTTPILGFDETTRIGTLKEPFVVDFRNSKAHAYPNPFRDVITFSAVANPGDVVSIRVFDTAGSMVFSYEETAESNRFEYTTDKLASLTQGMYIARITVGGVEKAVKIVKK